MKNKQSTCRCSLLLHFGNRLVAIAEMVRCAVDNREPVIFSVVVLPIETLERKTSYSAVTGHTWRIM